MHAHLRWKLLISIFLVLVTVFLVSCSSSGGSSGSGATSQPTKGDEPETPMADVARPSNGGGPGEAVNLKGDPAKGKDVFQNNCIPCHAAEGKGGVPNPGSKDETVPALNPIDETIANKDYKTFATNVDLFVEHGSTPEPKTQGTTTERSMPAFGDNKVLAPQQIADVIAYVISLNQK